MLTLEFQNDWKRHKALCKAFKALEEDTMASIVLNASLTPTGMAETDPLNNMSETFVQNSCQLIGRKMGRPLNMFERNAVAWQPRCLAWYDVTCMTWNALSLIKFH